jgi:hypothetical protein
MNGEILFFTLFGMILLGYIVLYINGKKYLENFQGGAPNTETGPTVGDLYPTPPPVNKIDLSNELLPSNRRPRLIMETTSLDPVAKDAIKSVDDYEYNLVFQNESDRSISTALRNKLMSQRPMDWSGLPPSSSQFQAGLRESFENATPTVPENAHPYTAISGTGIMPPDTQSIEMEERRVLQTYKPPTIKEMGSYKAESSPEELIKKLYEVKGLIPTVAHKEGTAVYEIVGVRRKDEKVLYEDEEAPALLTPDPSAGEARITVPPAALDYAAAKDPYYDTNPGAGERSRTGKWNYQSWTPGLERSFGPTNPKEQWY